MMCMIGIILEPATYPMIDGNLGKLLSMHMSDIHHQTVLLCDYWQWDKRRRIGHTLAWPRF